MDVARRSSPVRLSWIAVVALVLALLAIAVDHLLGTERGEGESGLADPATFLVSAGLCVVAAALLFGWVVPRARGRGPDRSASVGLACSVLCVVPGVAFAWLGFPFVIAGAGVELGLEGRAGARRLVALAAVGLGAAALTLGAAAYGVAAVIGITEL